MITTKHHRFGGVLLALIAMISPPWCYASDEPERIQEAVRAYVEAIANHDHPTYIKHLSRSSIDYIMLARERALTLSAEETVLLSPYQKFMVLISRAQLTEEQLHTSSVHEYLTWFNHLVPPMPNARPSVKHLEISGDTAKVDLEANGRQVPFTMTLVKEDGVWKIELRDGLADEVIEQLAHASGMSVNGYIFQLAKQASHGAVTVDLWNPLVGERASIVEPPQEELFIGKLENGYPVTGTMVFASGIIYRGEFSGWTPRGKGTAYSWDGSVINGTFGAEGVIGNVEYTWPDKSRFYGELKHGRPHGPGRCEENGHTSQCEYADGERIR